MFPANGFSNIGTLFAKTQLQYHNFNKLHFLKCENVTFSSWHVAYSNFCQDK
uniref:Uncharacterized protein n=1 Tax=Anguilla anguilla TaxID=7936 RepID=A0A0E9RT05_ANGAN